MLRLERLLGSYELRLFLAGAGMLVATVAFLSRLTAQGGQPIAGTGAVTGACHVSPIVAEQGR